MGCTNQVGYILGFSTWFLRFLHLGTTWYSFICRLGGGRHCCNHSLTSLHSLAHDSQVLVAAMRPPPGDPFSRFLGAQGASLPRGPDELEVVEDDLSTDVVEAGSIGAASGVGS
jgi:hypothetical protein